MPKIRWVADVVVRPDIVLKDGEDPKPTELYKDVVIEVSDSDPYIRRAIARGLAVVIADPELAAHTTPEGKPSTPQETTDTTTTEEEEAV